MPTVRRCFRVQNDSCAVKGSIYVLNSSAPLWGSSKRVVLYITEGRGSGESIDNMSPCRFRRFVFAGRAQELGICSKGSDLIGQARILLLPGPGMYAGR